MTVLYSYLIVLATGFLMVSISCQQPRHNEAQAVVTPAATPAPAVLYRSTDRGATWSPFAKGLPADATLSGIKQAGNSLYITTDYHGIFRSVDGQNDWVPLPIEPLENLDINCIEVVDNRIVIGTLHYGILTSDNEGKHWVHATIKPYHRTIRAFIRSKGIWYAGTDAGIYQSTDKGKTRSHVFGIMQILGFTSWNDKIYAAPHQGALVCDHAPADWRAIYEGDALHDIGNDGQYVYAMTISRQLLKTKNDGATWENAQNGIVQPANYYTNELQHIGPDIFSAQWIGIYHSSDHGNSWQQLSGLPPSTAFSTLEITDFGILAGISIR